MTIDIGVLISDLNEEMAPVGLRVTEIYGEFWVWRGDHRFICKVYSENELIMWLAGYQAAFRELAQVEGKR